jgi:hypothetical protein
MNKKQKPLGSVYIAYMKQIMTEPSGAESEEDRIMTITRIVLNLMKQNGC